MRRGIVYDEPARQVLVVAFTLEIRLGHGGKGEALTRFGSVVLIVQVPQQVMIADREWQNDKSYAEALLICPRIRVSAKSAARLVALRLGTLQLPVAKGQDSHPVLSNGWQVHRMPQPTTSRPSC